MPGGLLPSVFKKGKALCGGIRWDDMIPLPHRAFVIFLLYSLASSASLASS